MSADPVSVHKVSVDNPSPRARYVLGREGRAAELRALEARAGSIGMARLVVAIGAIALVGAIAWAHLPGTAWGGIAALVLAFAALVVVHARVHAKKDRALAAVNFHDRAIERLDGKWTRFASRGERFSREAHAYADDLDVFGRASLFQLIDATSTRLGEETLAAWLSDNDTNGWPERVALRQAAVKDLSPRLGLREELAVQGSLLGADKPDPRPFVAWAARSPNEPPPAALPKGSLVRWAARLVPASTIALFVLAQLGKVPSAAWIGSLVVGLLFSFSFRASTAPITTAASSKESGLVRYGDMLAVLEREKFETPLLVSVQAKLRASGASATEEMAALARIVGFLDARENEVFRLFIGPVLLWDLNCALALEAWRARAGTAVGAWFEALAEMEALASLAGFAFDRPDHVFPELVKAPSFAARSLGHPLIAADKRVCNDVALRGPGTGLVVTGSNMSGKSTLLRAIGINAVLARTGAPVCATEMSIGPVSVATSMRVRDSLEEGVSRFYAELKKLRLVVEQARTTKGQATTVLFLLDEILHGTNTRERLIGARAIVKELLSCGAMGAVSTHDLALGDLETELAGKVRNVHFEEQVANDVMTFDYRLRDGVVQSSNALRLMKIVGIDVV